jgi:hypothetical protein
MFSTHRGRVLLVSYLSLGNLCCAYPAETGSTSKLPPESRGNLHSEPVSEPGLSRDFLTASLWNDGKAEIAFYDVEIHWRAGAEPFTQKFEAVAILVKQSFDPRKLTKVPANDPAKEESFQWSFIYDLGANKRSAAVIALQVDLKPLKQTYTEISWEGSCYRELALPLGGKATRLFHCQTQSEPDLPISFPPKTFTPVELPLLVRSLDFSTKKRQQFRITSFDGSSTLATADLVGTETVQIHGAALPAEKIKLQLSGAVPYPGGMLSLIASEETYWRSTGPNRQILRIASRREDQFDYQVRLIEEIRADYWTGKPLGLKYIKEFP